MYTILIDINKFDTLLDTVLPFFLDSVRSLQVPGNRHDVNLDNVIKPCYTQFVSSIIDVKYNNMALIFFNLQ